MTEVLIIIGVVLVLALIAALIMGRQAKTRRDEGHRIEAREHREEAGIRSARADSKEAEAEEKAREGQARQGRGRRARRRSPARSARPQTSAMRTPTRSTPTSTPTPMATRAVASGTASAER